MSTHPTPQPAEERAPWGWLALFTVASAVLCSIHLDRGLWLDEYYTLIRSIRRPLGEILTIFPGDTQHMLHAVLARIFVVLFGEHAWTIRLPAVLFGVGAVPALYFCAREMTSRREALLGSALLTVSYHHVWFSQNARGYTGMLFFTLVSTYFLLRGLKTGERRDWTWYAVCAALGVFAHLTTVFLIAAHGLASAAVLWLPGWRGEKFQVNDWRAPLTGFLMAGVFTLLLYAGVLAQVQEFFNRPSKTVGISTPSWAFWETLRGLQIALGALPVVILAGLICLLGWWSYWRESRAVAALLVLPGILTALGALAARGTMYPRFYFYLLGFAVLIVVRGAISAVSVKPFWKSTPLSEERRAALGTALVIALIGVSAWTLTRNYRIPKQDFESAVQFVETQRGAAEPVLLVGEVSYPIQAYFERPWRRITGVEELDAARASGQRVWVLYTFPIYIEREAPGLLAVVQQDCAEEKVFYGSVGGGNIVVCRLAAK